MTNVMANFAAAVKALQSVEGMGVTSTGRPQKYGKIAKFGRIGVGETKSHIWGADILITLDKASLADAMGRLEVYKSIPSDIAGEALTNVGTFFIKEVVKARFETESGPYGAWPGLSERQIKTRNGLSHPILRHKGDLFAAVTSTNQMIDVVVSGTYARLLIGPNAGMDELERMKFYVHNLGSTGGAFSPIPARPFMPISAEDLDDYEREEINKIMKQSVMNILQERLEKREANAKFRAAIKKGF